MRPIAYSLLVFCVSCSPSPKDDAKGAIATSNQRMLNAFCRRLEQKISISFERQPLRECLALVPAYINVGSVGGSHGEAGFDVLVTKDYIDTPAFKVLDDLVSGTNAEWTVSPEVRVGFGPKKVMDEQRVKYPEWQKAIQSLREKHKDSRL